MVKRTATLYPTSAKTLQALGQRLKDARLRRRFSAETVAARAGIGRQTLAKIEAGAESVSMGNYFQVLVVLGLEQDIHAVARDDVLGRRLQDAELPHRQRAPRTTAPALAAGRSAPGAGSGRAPASDPKRVDDGG